MPQQPLLPLADYQRIYEVAYSVLETSGIAATHRSCIFFAAVGTMILRDRYGLPATISAGSLALMVDEEMANIVVYGREENGVFVSDKDAFHAWVECDGWLIDFMSPIMGAALKEDGRDNNIPRRMLQKHLGEREAALGNIQHIGEYFIRHDAALVENLLDAQGVQFANLMSICMSWFRRPPEPMASLAMGESHGSPRLLVARAPSIEGVW
jgi:hypothetical protein